MKFIKPFWNFVLDILKNRRLIWSLTKNDFRQRYVGNFLGILWAFIQPTVTIMIFWFVFEVGFKSVPIDNFPFILWLACGMFPWFFFCDSINSATYSIVGNSYLVKKVVFRVSLLPIVQISSAFIVHLFFVFVLFVMFMMYGYWPSVYNLQVIYYDFALACLIFGLTLITSSLVVFLKDIGQLVSMCIQFGFWATPIFWSIKMMPESYHWIIKLNPVYYIVNGYREAFIGHKWFWQSGCENLYFWTFTCLTMFLGVFIFKKLRPHFADVI